MSSNTSVQGLRKAAEQGDAQAQLNYALLYAQGRGVPRDRLMAYFWLLLASAQLPALASRPRDEIASYLSPTQCAVAQVAARTWKSP